LPQRTGSGAASGATTAVTMLLTGSKTDGRGGSAAWLATPRLMAVMTPHTRINAARLPLT
jgi:hypothetical protein